MTDRIPNELARALRQHRQVILEMANERAGKPLTDQALFELSSHPARLNTTLQHIDARAAAKAQRRPSSWQKIQAWLASARKTSGTRGL